MLALMSKSALAAIAVSLVATNAKPLPYAFDYARDFTNIAIRQPDILRDLGPHLSLDASIVFPDDQLFGSLTSRYSEYNRPNFWAVVSPGVEADIAKIVKYANKINLPFLSVNRGHGSTKTLGNMQHGILINVKSLSGYHIARDGKTARLQGGAWAEGIIQGLWDAGYVTTTGSCDCTGLLGPGLGGGFGRLMGFYGMVSDSFVSLDLVLADGTEVTTSATKNPDLFWAVKGAGHNFGIVKSFTKKIYPKPVDMWYYALYVFTSDKLEELTRAINKQNDLGKQPKELVTAHFYAYLPPVSTTEPVIALTLQYAGSKEQAAEFYAPYDALKPISRQEGSVPYPKLGSRTMTSTADAPCQLGEGSHVNHPIGLLQYNVTTQRQILEHYKKITQAKPQYINSTVMLESYSVVGMKNIPESSSAYPHREDNLLVTLGVQYNADPSLDAGAIQFSKEMRKIWGDGQPGRKCNAYVNYAFGDESNEEMYGHDAARLNRLKSLKKKYDPKGRFNFYNPIETN